MCLKSIVVFNHITRSLHRPYFFPYLFFFFYWQVIDLKTQLRYFENLGRLLSKEFGDAEAKTLLMRAVYLITIGTNDYLASIVTNSSTFQTYSQEEYVDMVIGNLTIVIKVTNINI